MLPRLAQVRRAAATGTMQEDPNIAENPTMIQPRAADEAVDPPRDGDCLFHCFYRSFENAPWIGDWDMYREKINSVNDMRHYIVKYMRRNSELFAAEHEGYIRNAVAGWYKSDIKSLPFKRVMRMYCEWMEQPTMWGGMPELDAGAMLLNVIVHQFFVPEQDGKLATARLSASFFPDPALVGDRKKMKAARAPYTKFVFILQNDHYYFVLPEVPRALQVGSGSDGSSSDDGVKLLKDLRRQRIEHHGDKGKVKDNALTRELTAAREARAAGNGGSCARKPVTLTDGQREQMEVEESDEAMARRLQQELDAEARQIQNDRRLAREWAGQRG